MKSYNLYQIDSFTKEKFTGNPAAVITNADGLSDEQMQKIARELNNSETAFIFKADTEHSSFKSKPHDVHVRFFTPSIEVPMCGHATIAAHYARAHELNLDSSRVTQKVGAGILPVDIVCTGNIVSTNNLVSTNNVVSINNTEEGLIPEGSISESSTGRGLITERSNKDYKIVMTQGEIEFDQPLDFDIVAIICEALGITTADIVDNAPIQIVSTGHSKVMVCIKSFQQLKQLNPDFEELIEISESIGCNGFLVFSKDMPDGIDIGTDVATSSSSNSDKNKDKDNNKDENDYFINARMFGPALGINEDPVNGSSGGALGAYLVKHKLIDSAGKSNVQFKVRQGFSVGRLGEVKVEIELDTEGNPILGKITGDAVIIFKTELVL